MALASILLAILTTTAEVNGLSHEAFASGRDVALTGTVTAVLHGHHYILEDATGRTHIRDLTNVFPGVGDVCALKGMTGVDAFLQEQTMSTNTAILGRGPRPAVVNATVTSISDGLCDYANVRVTGHVSECLRDDDNATWSYFVLAADGGFIYVTVPDSQAVRFEPERYTRAEVTVTGTVVPNHCGARRFVGPHVETTGPEAVRIVQSANGDAAPQTLGPVNHLPPTEVVRRGPVVIEGRVLAAWSGRRLLICAADGELHSVELVPEAELPVFGARVRVTGLPETDLFRLNLSKASCETLEPSASAALDGEPEFASKIPVASLQSRFHGRPVRVIGHVLAEPCVQSEWRATVVDSGTRFTVDASRFPELADALSVGAVVEVTGCGLIETENWRPGMPFPTSKGNVIVVRQLGDVKVISSPPFWTAQRLSIVLLVIFAVLVALVIWNRLLNRLVERRGRQLVRQTMAHAAAELRTDERTRLAVELHDSLSQTLTALACQIDSADRAGQKDPARVGSHLGLARRMLDSCRAELRNCLWDLRSHTLEEADTETAVRRTVVPHAGGAEVLVDFKIARDRLSDSTFHDILCILREFVANAVRHGGARHIRIEGRLADEKVTVTVTDDGCGFDPAKSPGGGEGHFGLMGVRERLGRHNGILEIDSAPGRSAVISFTLAKLS